MTFTERLRIATEDGIIQGVRLALALGLILLTVSYLLGDYNLMRHRASVAYEYVQQQQAAKAAP